MGQYKIILAHIELEKFINFLPDLTNGETFLVCLFARKKYVTDGTHISQDKQQLKRFTATKQNLISKLRQLEVALGVYQYNGVPIPQEALVTYITLNPRSFEKATKNSLIKFAELVTKPYTGYNPHQEVLSEIQRGSSISRKVYMDFDFDNITAENLHAKLIDLGCINTQSYNIMETRGGCHLLVKMDSINRKFEKTWYQSIIKLDPDNRGTDTLVPIPGCTQGSFIPTIKY